MRRLACDTIGSGNRPSRPAGVRLQGQGGESAPPRRGAFTLAELVVSIGILALMMVMAGTVFKLTLDSTGQANALIDVSQSLRLLEQTLREDLAQTPRQGAVLVIEANPINAYWRSVYVQLDDDDDPSTGYLHDSDPERETTNLDLFSRPIPQLPRADVLMTFTARTGQSCLCPDVMGQVQQVVYGHAELGELDAAGDWVDGAPNAFFDHTDDGDPLVFATPAEEWHLARRSVLIVDGIVTDPPCPAGSVEYGLDDESIPVATPDNLWDGTADIVAKDPGDDPPDYPNSFHYLHHVVQLSGLAGVDLADWFARSRLDLAPPARHANRLGHYFIPHCASFTVEWALDVRRFVDFSGSGLPEPTAVVWFDPMNSVDPFTELDALGAVSTELKNNLVTRFPAWDWGAPVGEQLGTAAAPVWYANDSVNPGGSMDEPDRYFPDALRITVDLYDDGRKLTRPLRHVMVLPVGR